MAKKAKKTTDLYNYQLFFTNNLPIFAAQNGNKHDI